jgi:hypothetical protein
MSPQALGGGGLGPASLGRPGLLHEGGGRGGGGGGGGGEEGGLGDGNNFVVG